MRLTRLCTSLLLACSAAWMPASASTAYPARAVEVIVPYATGGGVGAMARVFAAEAARVTGQQWVVHNREGAGGVIGFTAIARAEPNGYTVGFSPASPMTNAPFLNPKMPFNNDQIEPVCQVFENVFAIAVKEDSPYRSLNDLVEAARQKPGTLSYGHAGPASIPHMAIAALEQGAGVKFSDIPYRGDGPVIIDIMGGTLDFAAAAIGSLAGKNLRVLAVLADKPHPVMSDAPTIASLGYPSISPGLNGLYVPTGTPRDVVQKIEAICEQVVKSPEFAKSILGLMQVPEYLPADAFKARVKETYEVHAKLVPTLKLDK